MNWTGKRVLVTGAGGFIGSHLSERLVELGAETRGMVHYRADGSWGWLDRSPHKEDIEVVQGDICARDSLRRAMDGREIVFHLAALISIPYSYQTPESFLHANIEGTLNVLETAREIEAERIVQTSTSEVYGTARYVPIDEEHRLQGQSPYSASKIAADKLAEAFHLSFGLPVATIRPFNTYGPRQSARAVIPTIITQGLSQDEVHLGRLDPTRDTTFVEDTVSGFLSVAENAEAIGQVTNIASGEEISIGDLAALILKLLGKEHMEIKRIDERVRPSDSEVERLWADISKAKRVLDWSPEYSLEQGLTKTIEWIQENLSTYRLGTYSV